MKKVKQPLIERVSFAATRWVGTPASIALHTAFFFLMFLFVLLGWDFQEMLLVLTTIVSIEAIYLSLFIQITVNKASEHIEGVGEEIKEIGEDIGEVAEDIEGIEQNIGEVAEDIEGIEQDIDEIQEDDKEDEEKDEEVAETLKIIERKLQKLQRDFNALKK